MKLTQFLQNKAFLIPLAITFSTPFVNAMNDQEDQADLNDNGVYELFPSLAAYLYADSTPVQFNDENENNAEPQYNNNAYATQPVQIPIEPQNNNLYGVQPAPTLVQTDTEMQQPQDSKKTTTGRRLKFKDPRLKQQQGVYAENSSDDKTVETSKRSIKISFKKKRNRDSDIDEAAEVVETNTKRPRINVEGVLEQELLTVLGTQQETETFSYDVANQADIYVCGWDKCPYTFHDQQAYYDHVAEHVTLAAVERTFAQGRICRWDGCGINIQNKTKFMVHIRTHTGEKLFKCNIPGCAKVYAQQTGLDHHMLTHTQDRPYKCEDCDKSFKSKKALKEHHKTHTGEKSYTCSYEGCGKAFGQSGVRDRHERTHSGTKRFSCSFEGCNKGFDRKCRLNDHMKLHTKTPDLICTYNNTCKAAFFNQYDLDRHHETHKNPDARPCPYEGCYALYAHRQGLDKHIKQKHS